MGLSVCNLLEKLADLTEVEGEKYHIVYSSAGSALYKRFLQSLKKDTVFTTNGCLCGRWITHDWNMDTFEVSNIYAMDIQRGFEAKNIQI